MSNRFREVVVGYRFDPETSELISALLEKIIDLKERVDELRSEVYILTSPQDNADRI